MAWHFGAAALGVLRIRLLCPHCGEVQHHSRLLPHETYRCKFCGKTFARSEGERGIR